MWLILAAPTAALSAGLVTTTGLVMPPEAAVVPRISIYPPSVDVDTADVCDEACEAAIDTLVHVDDVDDRRTFEIGASPSADLVEVDAFGEPVELGGDDFVFVDEDRCNGCARCSGIAPATFFAEPNGGKGRAYRQGEPRITVDEALSACPTQAISRVSFAELKAREQARDHEWESWRCADCPNDGCYDCHDYADKGANPVFKERERKASERRIGLRVAALRSALHKTPVELL